MIGPFVISCMCLTWKCKCLHVLTSGRHMLHISATVRYTSRWQWHVYLGGSATYISAAVRHLFRRQCDTYLDGSATLVSVAVRHIISEAVWCNVCISGSVTFIWVVVQRFSQWQCNVDLGGSATFISAAVRHLSRRQCHIYLDGSVTCISTAVSFIHICEGLVFVCSILLNMQCCDNNCGNFTQYFMSYIFSVLWLCMLYSESHIHFICGYLFIFSRITNVCGHE